jgi:glycine betaine/choline ABC-type transport system substrate-binding protein
MSGKDPLQMICRLGNATMQRLNFQVDEKKRTPKEVARKFLKDRLMFNF